MTGLIINNIDYCIKLCINFHWNFHNVNYKPLHVNIIYRISFNKESLTLNSPILFNIKFKISGNKSLKNRGKIFLHMENLK